MALAAVAVPVVLVVADIANTVFILTAVVIVVIVLLSGFQSFHLSRFLPTQ